MRRAARLGMRGAVLLSLGAHVIAAAAFIELSRERQNALVPVMPAPDEQAVEVEILADPKRGVMDGAETADTVTAISPPADATTAAQPTPEAPPEPSAAPEAEAPAALPAPPTPAPRTAARAAPPAPMLRPRAGATDEGRDDGTTEIVLGQNTVPAGPDPAQYNIPPRYPPEAVRRGQQGLVRLSVVVATDGSALSVEVAESSGSAALDRAAREAVARWHFRPAREEGMTVPSTIPVTLSFVLENQR